MDWQLERAKHVCEKHGYVVIPRERHRVLTVEQAASASLLEMLQGPEEAASFRKHMDDAAARAIGPGLQDIKAITKEAFGPDPDQRIYRWRYRVGVILPKP